MFIKKYTAAFLGLVLLGALLAACGGSAATNTPGSSSNSSSVAASPTAGSVGSSGSAASPTDSSTGSTGSTGSTSSGQVQVVQSVYYVNQGTNEAHVVGIIKNGSGGDLMNVSVQVSLLDDSGSTVASGSSISFDGKLFPTDAQSGFNVVLDKVPAKYAKLDVSVDAQPYADGSIPAPARNLVLSGDSLSDSGLGSMQVSSTVTNKGSKDVNNVFVIATFTDDAGNVLDVSELVAGSTGEIPAGGAVQSIVGSERSDIKPTKYMLYVSGMEK